MKTNENKLIDLLSWHARSCLVCLRETSCHAWYSTLKRADIAYRERSVRKAQSAENLVTGAEHCASGVNSFEPVIADHGAARRFQALRSQCVPGVRPCRSAAVYLLGNHFKSSFADINKALALARP